MKYKILHNNTFDYNAFKLVPIRFEDRMDIMKWRNEQIYHLRQQQPLTPEGQDDYFSNVVARLFDQEKPDQILFSLLENDVCIGYGGLVHINWVDSNAEISFIMDTSLEKDRFQEIWVAYLKLLERVAFEELGFHKIYTYAFDLRPHLYKALEAGGFTQDARLKEHCFFKGEFLDVIFHARINNVLSFRKATLDDLDLYHRWTNDPDVRANSYQTEPISLEVHSQWFRSKVNDSNYYFLVFENHVGVPVGQVRIQITSDNQALIGISNDAKYRGKGYARQMLEKSTSFFLSQLPQTTINAYIKIGNKASVRAFEKAGFILEEVVDYGSIPSFHYIKRL